MVVIRPTRKLHSALPGTQNAGASDTALGDWYVNRVVVDRQPLLLLVSATSLLPALVRARNVRALPTQIGDIVVERLTRLAIPKSLIEAERRAMATVHIGATVDRSVLGILVDFAKGLHYCLKPMLPSDQPRIAWRRHPVTRESQHTTSCFQSRRRLNS